MRKAKLMLKIDSWELLKNFKHIPSIHPSVYQSREKPLNEFKANSLHKFMVTVGLQIYKMINLGSNVIVYKLKHCVLHFEVNMMTF